MKQRSDQFTDIIEVLQKFLQRRNAMRAAPPLPDLPEWRRTACDELAKESGRNWSTIQDAYTRRFGEKEAWHFDDLAIDWLREPNAPNSKLENELIRIASEIETKKRRTEGLERIREFFATLQGIHPKPNEADGNSDSATHEEPPGGSGFGDADQNKEVETASINAVIARYESEGWQVKSVERDRVGYDLHCTRKREVELAEVKGIAGFSQMCIVTEGERQVAAKRSGSVVWLVTAALSKPELHRYSGFEFLTMFELTPIQYRARLRLRGVSGVDEAEVSS